MADLKKLTFGGEDGGNTLPAAVYGGPSIGTAVWEIPKGYDPTKTTCFLPFLQEQPDSGGPLPFLAVAGPESARAVPYSLGVVRVQLLDDDGQETGEAYGLAVGFVTPPKPGETVRVAFLLAREQ